jgi:hypothetical protein
VARSRGGPRHRVGSTGLSAPPTPAVQLAAPPGQLDLGHGASVNLETGRYTPEVGPKI